MSERKEFEKWFKDAENVLLRALPVDLVDKFKKLCERAYDKGWQAARATDAPKEYAGWYCAHCKRGVDGSEVTYHEQHQECGRVITNDNPPARATDAEPVRSSVIGMRQTLSAMKKYIKDIQDQSNDIGHMEDLNLHISALEDIDLIVRASHTLAKPEIGKGKSFWVLYDATSRKKWIKKSLSDGSLAFFDYEHEAKAAKLHHGSGVDYKKVTYFTAPKPESQIPEGWKLVPDSMTEEMQRAFESAPLHEDTDIELNLAYQAMIAAASQQPAKPDVGAMADVLGEWIRNTTGSALTHVTLVDIVRVMLTAYPQQPANQESGDE